MQRWNWHELFSNTRCDVLIRNIYKSATNSFKKFKKQFNCLLAVLDASASPSAGHVWGNNFWMGSYHGCLFLNEPPKIYLALNDHIKNYKNLTDIQSPMPVQYRMFYVNHDSTLQLDIDLFNKVWIRFLILFEIIISF